MCQPHVHLVACLIMTDWQLSHLQRTLPHVPAFNVSVAHAEIMEMDSSIYKAVVARNTLQFSCKLKVDGTCLQICNGLHPIGTSQEGAPVAAYVQHCLCHSARFSPYTDAAAASNALTPF